MTSKTQPAKSKVAANKLASAKRVGVNISVPADLHRRFRIAAFERDLTLADAITAAMDEWAGGQ